MRKTRPCELPQPGAEREVPPLEGERPEARLVVALGEEHRGE